MLCCAVYYDLPAEIVTISQDHEKLRNTCVTVNCIEYEYMKIIYVNCG